MSQTERSHISACGSVSPNKTSDADSQGGTNTALTVLSSIQLPGMKDESDVHWAIVIQETDFEDYSPYNTCPQEKGLFTADWRKGLLKHHDFRKTYQPDPQRERCPSTLRLIVGYTSPSSDSTADDVLPEGEKERKVKTAVIPLTSVDEVVLAGKLIYLLDASGGSETEPEEESDIPTEAWKDIVRFTHDKAGPLSVFQIYKLGQKEKNPLDRKTPKGRKESERTLWQTLKDQQNNIISQYDSRQKLLDKAGECSKDDFPLQLSYFCGTNTSEIRYTKLRLCDCYHLWRVGSDWNVSLGGKELKMEEDILRVIEN